MAEDTAQYSGFRPGEGDLENPALDKAAQEEAELQSRKLNRIAPIANTLIEFIEDEKKAIYDVRTFLNQNIKDGALIQAEFRARELYEQYLDAFQEKVLDHLDVIDEKIQEERDERRANNKRKSAE